MLYVMNCVLYLVAALYSAVVFVIGWDTFVVPLGVPPVSVVHAIGLLVLASLTTVGRDTAIAQLLIAAEATTEYWQTWVIHQCGKSMVLIFLLLCKVLM